MVYDPPPPETAPPIFPLPAPTGLLPATFFVTPEGLQNFEIVRLEGGDIDTRLNLITWVLISLFSWARDDTDEGSRNGWWGSALSSAGLTGPWGSRLWKLARAKLSAETARDARAYMVEALDWLVSDKIASSVQVDVARVDGRGLRVDLVVKRGPVVLLDARFADVWKHVVGSNT